jgi:hypothetical protein
LIDSFIEGDLQLNDVLNRLNEGKGSSRAAVRAARDNKRISEMFRANKVDAGSPSRLNPILESGEGAAAVNKTGMFTLKDFINDDADNSEQSES